MRSPSKQPVGYGNSIWTSAAREPPSQLTTPLLAAATAGYAPTVLALEPPHPPRGIQDAVRTGPERMGIGADSTVISG
ncbi:hypothetical protein [Nocardia vaccinii]|uniref:hypothetical protein n=1 Tax=Nocardia vaccinii TaxID=1822 RepID=UPI000830B975